MATSSGTTTSSKPHIPQLVAPSGRYIGTFSSLGAYIPSSVRYYLPASVQAAVGGSGTGAAAPGSAAGGSSSSSSSGTASNDDALDTLLTAAWQTLHTRSNSSQLCSHRAGRRRRRSRARRRALYLCLGYTNGFQVWDVSRLATSAASARFQEVLSVRKLHAVRIVHMLEPAAASKPATSASSDSAAFDASAHGQLVAVACADTPNAPSCSVQIYAAATKRFVHTLRFQSQVHGITSNATHVAVSLRHQIFVFHAATLDNAYAVSCYPNAPGSAVAALGSHWLAYASAQPAPTAAAQAHADGDRGRGSSASSSAHGSSGSGSSGGGAGAGANTGMASASAGANMRSSSAAAAGSHSRMRGAAPPPLPPASAATGTSDSFMGGLWGVAKDIASGLYYLTDVSKSTIAMMSGSEQQQGATTATTTAATTTTTTTTTTQTGSSSTSKKAPSAVPRAAAGCVVVRDIASRRVVARFRAHHKALAAAAFDSSGTLLATSSADGQTVHVHRLVPCRAGQHAGSSAVMRQTLLQHQDLFRLERGLTHAHVRNLAFSSDSMWLAATSARGTTHVFSLHADPVAPSANTTTTTTTTAAGAPPAAALGGTPSYARGAADDSTAGTGDTGEQPRVRTAVPHTAATVGSAASADAAAAAAAGLQQDYRGHALAVGSGPAAGSAQRPAYLAAWEEATGSTRRHAVVARGSTLRVHHAAPSTAAADSSSSSSSNTTTTTTAATATATEGAGSAGGDHGEGGDTTTKQAAPVSVGTTTVCCAHFAGTRLLVSTFGMLHRHTLGVVNDPHDATGATVSDAGGGVVAVREVVAVDTWDVHRRRAWAELHDLRQHSSSSSSDDDGSAAAGAPPAWGALVDDELRAHWLSNAEILTHTPPVVPLWASPQFSMHPMSASAAKATGGSAASGGSLSTTDLFFNPRGTAAVVVRRSGPQPVLRPQDGNAGWGDPAFALSASIMDGHFGRTSAASSSSPSSSSSPTPPPPPTAPSAPPPTKQVGPGMEPSASGTVPVLGSVLAAGIRQALETPLQDDFNPTMGAATASSTGGGSMDDASFGIRPSDMPRHPSIASASSNTSGLSSGSLAGATMADEAYFDAGRWTPSDTAPVTAVMDLAPPPAPLHPGRSNSRSSGGGAASGSGVGIGAWDDESDWLDAHLSAAANVVTANKVSYTATATTATTATAAGGATAPTKGARSMSEEHEDLL